MPIFGKINWKNNLDKAEYETLAHFMQDMEPYAVNHGPLLTVANCVETPKAPPRRKRPQRKLDKEMQPLRRSLSFTDAHFIAQAVYEGDTKLIEELYPDFPR